MRPRKTSLGMLAVLALAACGGGGSNRAPVPPAPNRAPSFTSSATVSAPAGSGGSIYSATAADPDGDSLVFSIAGGADGDAFRITGGGALSFATPPDFDAPVDADRDNVYLVELGVSDGQVSAALALTVTVTRAAQAAFRVRRVSAAFQQPVFLAPVPDGSGRVFVVERQGRIRLLDPASGAIPAAPFLDAGAQIALDGERGLLGFATAPGFQAGGAFYVFLTNLAGVIEVRRYRTLVNDPDRADPASADVILSIPHPRNNHNGGWIGFGPDAFLYVALGDGGGSGDPDGNGQNSATLLGKILRLDVARDDFPDDPLRDYAIPAGNPFAGGGGAPEIWALGLRNPFRNSFDSATGNLLIADVGQNAIEEIDLMTPDDGGANFGWALVEGTRPFNGQPNASLTPPVAEYAHGSGPREGNSVTGGYVYRGPVESLRGQYIFADFIRPNIWSVQLSRLVLGETLPSTEFIVRTQDFAPDAGAFTNIASFGVDAAGNLYIVDIDGEIFVVEPRP